ncbi:hemagglutinin repeat-containing protein [uncultured Phascolarctobacterium sp.]|uniref:two-partner secretion domain-containing protein n=1 Tax=uncultured Phascolarctobacterium sp. TaxID=512296 RepID=UPI0025FB79EE|nr:hemagglutinin repeat-containing protein [uncultured Phascolarctobacterium sp.]
MGNLGKNRKKFLALAIALSLQMQAVMPCYATVTAEAGGANVNGNIINIVKPDSNGLSHNKFTDFNVAGNGIVFNNHTGSAQYNSHLAGVLNANVNLQGNAAKLILTEVTGTGKTNLNGMLEIAGTKADLVIANPNGIVGKGFGFINVGRATLTTGVPDWGADGKLNGFSVATGTIDIQNAGLTEDQRTDYRPDKLDIMARAIKINDELWANKAINVVAGSNEVKYNTDGSLEVQKTSATAEKPQVALDVAALGGMYAGRIMLVGTEKGLGMNIGGNLKAQENLSITNDGRIVFTKNSGSSSNATDGLQNRDYTSLTSDGTVMVSSTEDIENSGVITAQKDMTLTVGGKLTNSGTLEAGAAYTAEEEEENPKFLQDAATLRITADEIANSGNINASSILHVASAKAINNDGYMHSSGEARVSASGILSGSGSIGAKSSVNVQADKVTLNKNNIYTICADGNINNTIGVSITEINPDKPVIPATPNPEVPREAEDFKAPALPDIAQASGVAATVKKDKIRDNDLDLVADANANGKYKPIIDKAANGVDLVQIAEVNGNGVSRNLYSDFNIKSTGLILNNATKYTKTELGGYIDRNMFLAGKGARVILNEVTSSNASTLNGYLEVAGNKASVVIANVSGISVNGLGFINTDNVVLSTGAVTNWADDSFKFSDNKGDMIIAGDGLNARNPKQLDVFTNNIQADKSELYANELHISADGLLQNTSKIAATENMQINAGLLKNSNLGYIEAKKNLTATVSGDVEQDKATLKAGEALKVSAAKLSNTNNSLLASSNDADINITTAIDNAKSIILAGQNLDVRAADFINQDTALVNYGQNGMITVANKFANDGATISADGSSALTKITATDFSNTNKGAFVSKGSLQLEASNMLNNNYANIYVSGDGEIKAGMLLNSNLANLHTGGDAKITADTMRSSKASVDVQGNLEADLGSFTNQDSAFFGVGKNVVINTSNDFTNKDLGNIFVTKNLTINSIGDFLNEDGLVAVGGSGTISATNITNQNKAGVKQGSLINAAGDLSLNAQDTVMNRSSDIESEGNISIKAKNLVNKKEIFETSFKESHEDISYKIPHLNAPNYYDAVRKFDRQILTAQIDKETADANIIASGNIKIDLDKDLTNHYSKIKAGKNLTVNAGGTVENVGYQGTVHYYDRGNDYHYWKYKKHRRMHIRCRWVYGTTVLPYYDHTMRDEEGTDSERLSLLSGVSGVKIEAKDIVNKTHQAKGKVGDLPESDAYFKTDAENHLTDEKLYKEKQDVSTSVEGKADDKAVAGKDNNTGDKMMDISSLHINSKIFKLTDDATAKYLIETNKKFADYHEFLSSDYLLERVKADPEKVGKRLGDGYFEQQFVLQQIGTLTGKKYLGDYGSDMEQFAALMNAGAVVAEAMDLKVGVALTAEQMASLTTDIVWLVEEVVNGQKVLVPEVFLAQVHSEDLRPDGALIVGGEVELYSKQNIKNMGNIKSDGTIALRAENVSNKGDIAGENLKIKAEKNITNSGTMRAKVDAMLQAENITNEAATSETQYRELNQKKLEATGSISAGQNLTLEAGNSITNKGANLTAGKNLTLNADDVDIVTVAKEKHVAVAYGSSSAEIHDVQHQQSALSGENIRLNTKKDISIAGGILSAKNDVDLNAKGDVNLTAVKDLYSEESEVGKRGSSYYNHNKQVDEVVKGTTIAAKNDVSIASGKDINIKGSNVASEAGKADLVAKNNINIANETEYHERLHEEHNKVSGLLSSKTTDIYDYSKQNTVVGSNVSAGEIAISSKKDTNITGSNVVADNDVNVKTGGNLNIGSAEQTSESEYRKSVKKSGVFAGGGLGFTIGKEKQKDQYANQNVEQVGSTVGSVKGSVKLDADKVANVKGSSVVAGKNINITGENVSIENSNSVYNAQEKHEFKRTGLSVSVGGGYVDVVNNVANSVKHAADVEDKRLGALVAVKGYKGADKAIKNIKGNGGGKVNENLSINVSVGTTKSKSESNSTTTVANASEVKAGGDVNVTSTKKDINITGSNVEGKNVTLNAKENLNITASKNTNKTEQSSKSSSASVGASIGIDGTKYSVSGSMSKGEVSANGTTYNESTVTANKDLSFASGKDTSIKGGELSGEKVTGNVGKDLNIESKQDSNSYKENNKSAGASVGLGSNKAISGSASVVKIDSNYKSVTDQSGIYAGKNGFDIRVEANTDLKGGIISSTADADKNKLSTGTLTFEDIQNKADYKANGIGAKVNKNNNADYNEKGITPDIGMPASGEAESTTKATISKGTIEIRDKENQNQDINKLNRDTKNSLNKLGEIFDKTKIEERQELANLFGELAYNEIHKLADKNGWKDGDSEKDALHALVGGIMSELTGNGFLAGESASAINEMVQKKLSEQFAGEPDKHQWASTIIGGIVSQMVSGNAQAGASTAASGTKNNRLSLSQYEEFKKRLSKAKSNAERIEIYEKYLNVDLAQEKELVEKLKDQNFVNGLIKALEENPDLEIYDGVVIKGFSVIGDRDNNNYLSEGTGEILDDTHEKFIFHAEHPLYNSETGTTDLVSPLQKFINDNKEELQSLGKNVTMSYLTNGVDKIIDKLPDKISASPKACDVYVNGIKVLKSVSSSSTITIGEGVYDIYVDYNKYHGRTLALNTVSTVSTVALSLTVSNKLQNNFSDTLGYMLPLVDGGFAFLISQGSSKIKNSISEGDK